MTGKELRDTLLSKGFVLADIASKLDITPQTLNSRLNAKAVKVDFLKELSDITGLRFEAINNDYDKDFLLVPVYNLDAVGGSNNSVTDVSEFIVDYIPFKNARKEDISVPVTNNSMYPTYPPGCFVQIRKIEAWREYLEFGQVYVIALKDGRRLLKQIRKGPDNNSLSLKSFNAEYDDSEISKDFIQSVWLVLAKYQKSVM